MPFTLSHPAAILPFRRIAARYTSLCALVIGSASPDFVYFFSFGISGEFSHSLAGLFLYCIPASLLLYAAYYLFLREPLLALLPDAIAARMAPQVDWVPRNLFSILVIVGSCALGAATHIGWDAFTHGNTFATRNVDLLRMLIGPADGLKLPLYKVLQHLSSICGLLALAMALLRWIRRTPINAATGTSRHRHLSVGGKRLIVAALLATGLANAMAGMLMRPARTLEHIVFNGIVSGMAAMFLAGLAFCACWWIGRLHKAVGG